MNTTKSNKPAISKEFYDELCDKVINHASVISMNCQLPKERIPIETIERNAHAIVIYIRYLESRIK